MENKIDKAQESKDEKQEKTEKRETNRRLDDKVLDKISGGRAGATKPLPVAPIATNVDKLS